MTHHRNVLAAVIAALIFSGCSGGSHGSSVFPASSTTSTTRTETFSFVVPRATAPATATASNKRSAEYISANTQSLTWAVGWLIGGINGTPQQFASGVVNVSTCPTTNAGITCAVSFTVPQAPSNAYSLGFALAAGAWSAPNGGGTLLSGQSGLGYGPFATTTCGLAASQAAGQDSTCVFDLGGIVSATSIYQVAPAVIGTPSTIAMMGTFLDPTGAQIVGSACLSVTQAGVQTPFQANLVTQSGSVSFADSQSAANHCTASNEGAGNYGLTSADAVDALAYDGSTTAPSDEFWFPQPGVTNSHLFYTPLIVPANHVTISGPTGTPATLTVTPPATYTGAVQLAVTSCLNAVVMLPDDGTAATNVAASPLVSVSPGSVQSTAGSPVTFIISPTGAPSGVCTLTSSADGSQFGAVVSW